ncbi:unnamed protein product [Triticum turgidum subsp. durum]|uniref:ATP-cone domain-containing protein n=1 Tax=Triticum turgidum subsp. durum TaxID=4567 RepID=A0A9R0T087_TRITD|nr:unnamed protein product [Triticum turgidum subsp. durum]
MYVVKQDGRTETVHFDKITVQLKKLSYGHFDKSTATPCSSRKRSALGYTWVSPPASSTSSPPRPLPRSPPPSLTMPPYVPSFDLSLPFRSVPFPPHGARVHVSCLTYVRVWFFCSSRRGLLCPTYRQVEIVCVALVNKEHSCRKVQERIGKLVSFSLVSEK